jgi:hypothetical protein
MSGWLSGTRVAPTTDATVHNNHSARFDLVIRPEYGQRLGGRTQVRHGSSAPTLFADEINEEEGGCISPIIPIIVRSVLPNAFASLARGFVSVAYHGETTAALCHIRILFRAIFIPNRLKCFTVFLDSETVTERNVEGQLELFIPWHSEEPH